MFETILKIVDLCIRASGIIMRIAEMLKKSKHQKSNRPTKE